MGGILFVGKIDVLGGKKTIKYILKIGCEYMEGVQLTLGYSEVFGP